MNKIDNKASENTIVLSIADKEVLKITPDGFYVNGVAVSIENLEEHNKVVYETMVRFCYRCRNFTF